MAGSCLHEGSLRWTMERVGPEPPLAGACLGASGLEEPGLGLWQHQHLAAAREVPPGFAETGNKAGQDI